MAFYNIRKIWNPDWFQGNLRGKGYFEGWYFKIVNRDRSQVYAVIPGISLEGGMKDAYSFIQVINGRNGKTGFVKYPIESFRFSRKGFDISIGENRFTDSSLKLNLPESGFGISGEISFTDMVPYPVKLLSPGVMGWYRFVPTMECYHGILSMNHSIEGDLMVSGRQVDFSGGKGYIEKDWGKSMPLSWIWMQSNHFKREDMSVSFSIANIPWKRSAFTGFLIIVSAGNRFYRFTTYTGARITELSIADGLVDFKVSNRQHGLRVSAYGKVSGDLKAPVEGAMSRTIHESIGARVKIELHTIEGKLILEDEGEPAGLEIAGDIDILINELGSNKSR